MKKLNSLSKGEMKKIVGGGDEWQYPALCTRCVEEAEADPYHPPLYVPEGCVRWHCPTPEPPGPVLGR